MKNFFIVFSLIITVFHFPVTVSANIWEGTGDCNIKGPCNFCDAMKVIHNIIMLLFEIAIPIAVAMIVWGALRMMFSAGSQENFAASKKIMTNAFWGMLIALGAWIIVNTLIHLLAGGLSFPWNQVSC